MNETKMNINRVFWIDLIRVVSALFVVTIHVSTRVSGGFEPHGTSSAWLIAHTLNSSLNQFAVPLFIMISGALLLARSEEPLTFYQRRFGKILLPFIAWPAIYLLCRVFMGQTLENGVPITLASALGAIFTESTQICGHFWFFYILLSVYIAAPFLSVFVRNASKNTLYCFLGLWFFGVAVYPVLDKLAAELFGMTGFSPYLHFSLFSLWVGFFIAGYVLKDLVLTKGQAMFVGVLFCLLFFLEPVNGYLRNTNPESFQHNALWQGLTIFVIPIMSNRMTFALLAFLLLRYLGSFTSLATSKTGWAISMIAPLIFGIYLVHYLFVIFIMKILNLGKCESPLIALGAILIVSPLIYLISAGIIYFIRRIRWLKFLAP